MAIEIHPDYLHHSQPRQAASIREIVFGLEDGMVSTLGAITGIAAGTGDHFLVILSGLVIVAVESISMAAGSYLSSKSEKEIDERKLWEEKNELKKFPDEERLELVEMYVKDGWERALAESMAEAAAKNKKLFLQEMAYRELKIIPERLEQPRKNALLMGASYIIGGFIPLFPYFIFSTSSAVLVSVVLTPIGLFLLGVGTTKFSKRIWWKAGIEMLALASAAALIGYLVGQGVGRWWNLTQPF